MRPGGVTTAERFNAADELSSDALKTNAGVCVRPCSRHGDARSMLYPFRVCQFHLLEAGARPSGFAVDSKSGADNSFVNASGEIRQNGLIP
jgi:hypothetical protein